MIKDTLNSLLEPNKKLSSVPDTVVAPELTAPQYLPMYNGTVTNQIATIGRGEKPSSVDGITQTATIKRNGVTFFIEDYTPNEVLPTGSVKLLDILTLKYTQLSTYKQNDKLPLSDTVTLTIQEYVDFLGLPNPEKRETRKEASKRLKKFITPISRFRYEYGENNLNQYGGGGICSSFKVERGVLTFTFTQEIARTLTTDFVMQYPVDILSISERNPNAYPLARKLALHHSIYNNVVRGTNNIISVAKLLESAPEIPSYEDVMASNRAWRKRIVEAFEKAMDEIGPLLTWEYCNSKKVPLTDTQAEIPDYATFENLYIKFDLVNAPDLTQKIEEKKKRTKAKKKTSKDNKKEKE